MFDQKDELNTTNEYRILKQQFITGVSNRLSRLWVIYNELMLVEKDDFSSTLELLHYELHKLTGAAGIYGFPSLEYHSRKLEKEVWSSINVNKDVSDLQILMKKYYIELVHIEKEYHKLMEGYD